MSDCVTKLSEQLLADSKVLNKDYMLAYGKEQGLVVWSEGGEWPSYNSGYRWPKLEIRRSLLDVAYDAYASVKQAVSSIRDKHSSGQDVVAVAMDCGTGKSTELVKQIHANKFGLRTIVVEPSLATARGLAIYMTAAGAQFARAASEFPTGRALVYTNAGAFLDLAFSGGLNSDDVVVLDEAHCVTTTYEIVREILSRTTNFAVLFTASVASEYRTLRGVKLQMVDGFVPQVSEAIAKEPRNVVVGVHDNTTYAQSANMLIGCTLPLKLLYETGLRPEPYLSNGKICNGERVATKGEVVQMIGRLGRLKDSGAAFVHKDPKALQFSGISLYEVILNSIKSAMNLGGGLAAPKAVRAWQASGLIGQVGKTVEKGRVESGGQKSKELETLDVRPDTSDSDKSVSFDLPPPFDSEDEGVRVKSPKGLTRASYQYSRDRSSSSGSGSVTMDTGATDLDTGRKLSLAPCPKWRPFNRKGVSHISRSPPDLLFMLNKMGDSIEAGDTLYPAKFPLADSRQVPSTVRDETRMVLAGIMLPNYSELEALAVTVLWNDTVDSLGGRFMPKRAALQFTDYFRGYKHYEDARAMHD